ncbi:MAG TPA: hypothetical protein VLU23_20650 [Pseudolabrys sp.]|nr:hypothetical protein [Pseudolabrys sp.]
MRVSAFALVIIFICIAAPALAQAVIDVEGPKEVPSQAQDQGQQPQPVQQPPMQTPENSQAPVVEHAGLETEIASLRKEIASLKDEVATLKKEIAVLKEPPPPRPSADLTPPPDKGGTLSIKLPTQQDIARAREYLEEAWRRLVEMVVSVQKDIMRKG